METTANFKVWSSVVMLNANDFDQFVQGHEIHRTLYKVVLFVKLGDSEIRQGVSRFHYLAHHFSHKYALANGFRLLFAVYELDGSGPNANYPDSLPATSDRDTTAKLLVMKSLSDTVLEFGGELDPYSFKNNCSMFISECIKIFQKPSRQGLKWKTDPWYKCIGINEVSFYTDRPTDSFSDQMDSSETATTTPRISAEFLSIRQSNWGAGSAS